MKDFLKNWGLILLSLTGYFSAFAYCTYLHFTGVKTIHQKGWWGERIIYVTPNFYIFLILTIIAILGFLFLNFWINKKIKILNKTKK